MVYLPRCVDAPLTELLLSMGATVLEGPRGCGKTSTGLKHAMSSLRLDRDPHLVELAQLAPQQILSGKTPRLIDEWQLAPTIWNVLRHEIDDRQKVGQFILSGSATPDDDLTRHSGAGRIARLRMRPMSLAESIPHHPTISLSQLSNDIQVEGKSSLTYQVLAELATKGGWPALLQSSYSQGILFNRSYCDDLASTLVSDLIGTRPRPIRMRRLLESLARNISSEVTLSSLATDINGDGDDADTKTIRAYLDALERVFALEPLPAWSVALRSRSRLRTSPKMHMTDPALACAALGVGAERLAKDPEFFGQIFESMAIRDLRALTSNQFGRIYHYRDNTNLEVDAIIEYPDGRWAAIEVKLGSNRIPEAEKNLLRVRDERVDLSRVGNPAFMAVLTGTEYAYTLPSGIHVIPLGCLRP